MLADAAVNPILPLITTFPLKFTHYCLDTLPSTSCNPRTEYNNSMFNSLFHLTLGHMVSPIGNDLQIQDSIKYKFNYTSGSRLSTFKTIKLSASNTQVKRNISFKSNHDCCREVFSLSGSMETYDLLLILVWIDISLFAHVRRFSLTQF